MRGSWAGTRLLLRCVQYAMVYGTLGRATATGCQYMRLHGFSITTWHFIR